MKNDLTSSLRSLGVASHILSLGREAEVEMYPDRVAIRTPSQPNYDWGNCLLFRTTVREPDRQVAQFHRDFPEARHVAIFWDDPGARPSSDDGAFEELGFSLGTLEVLVLRDGAQAIAPPAGISVRELTTVRDWAKATDLQIETALEEGGDENEVAERISRRMASRRRSADTGALAWFGAFEGDHLVADAGVIRAPALQRFQAVETRLGYRRRGIASALVSNASRQARRDAAVPQLIIADTDSAAGRIYRRLGFALAERLVLATRPPSS